MLQRISIFILVLILFSACTSIANKRMKNKGLIDKIEYNFDDSSLPPEYHRSYTISVTSNKAHIIIDVYDDVIVDTSFTITKEQYGILINLAKELEFPVRRIFRIADGASFKNISLYFEDKKIYNLSWDSAKKVKTTTLNFVDQIKSLIPNLKELLDTPYIEENFN